MSSWLDFLQKNGKNAYRIISVMKGTTLGSTDTVESVNALALKLVNMWQTEQSYKGHTVVLGCDLTLPFYDNINKAAVLVAISATNIGIQPDTVGLDTLLNTYANFSSGYLERKIYTNIDKSMAIH